MLPAWASRIAWLAIIGLALFAHWLFVTYYPIDNIRRGWDYGLMGGAKQWMPRYNPFGFFATFAIGALAASLQVWLARYRHWLFDILAIAGILLTVWLFREQSLSREDSGFGMLEVPYGFPHFALAVGFVLVVTPSSMLAGQLLDNPVTAFVARISFGIYVWHYVVLELVQQWWAPGMEHGSERSTVAFIVASVAISAITVVIATLSFYLLERPAIRWARGLERRRTPEPISATAPA